MVGIQLHFLCQFFSNIPRRRVPSDDGTPLPLLDNHAMYFARYLPLVYRYICFGYLFEDDSVGVYPASPDEEGYDDGKEVCAGDDEDIGDIDGGVFASHALVDDVAWYY